MKRWIGFGCVAGLFALGPVLISELQSQQPGVTPSQYLIPPGSGASSSASAGNLISSIQVLPNGRTQVIVVDAAARTIATYFVSSETGGIELKSVRNIDADLRLKDFNGAKPTPDEVRAVVQP